jgi:hypothetical protein
VSINDGGPAFPVTENYDRHDNEMPSGMTLRAYIATAAMAAIITKHECHDEMLMSGESGGSHIEASALGAVAYADALIERLNR